MIARRPIRISPKIFAPRADKYVIINYRDPGDPSVAEFHPFANLTSPRHDAQVNQKNQLFEDPRQQRDTPAIPSAWRVEPAPNAKQ